MKKRKIKDRIKEYRADISHNRKTTALAQLNTEKKVKIDFNNVRKLAPFNNRSYAIKREMCEIITEPDTCNFMNHAQLHSFWIKILESRCWREASNNLMQNVADERGGTLRKYYNNAKD